jgi:mRNA interferase MazF
MKYKIVLVPFPFDDLTANKVRPAICLTDEIKPHSHIVLAFITSQVSASASATDFVIDKSDADFATTGLKVSSTIRLHRLMTVQNQLFCAN